MTIERPAFREFEAEIVAAKGKDKQKLAVAKFLAEDYKEKIDYVMERFVEDFGTHLDEDQPSNTIYHRFTKVMSSNYADATRFLRMINFYEGQHA